MIQRVSMNFYKKNGGRRGDVKPDTLKKRLDEFPTHLLKIVGDLQEDADQKSPYTD
jgi:hypothetical protein